MLEGISERLQGVMDRVRGRGRLTEQDVDQALREVRLALLEADVNFRVVKEFVAKVRERAVGREVIGALTPGQQVVKIVYDELTGLLGGTQAKLAVAPRPPTVIMLAGLQGSGKTTTVAKLALHLRKQGRHPFLIAADVHRPAAVDQLRTLGRQLDLPVFGPGGETGQADQVSAGRLGDHREDAVSLVREGVARARHLARDVVIIDTAGRLHGDEELMSELVSLKDAVSPHEILLVVDAMTGQDAVTVAERFHAAVDIDGVILSKMDGDARGGAALSVWSTIGRPIKFIGIGEKADALEPFHPDRLASRLLGMGDVLSLIEKAQAGLDQEKVHDLERKLRRRETLTLDDFREQLRQVRKLGPLDQILSLVPGISKMKHSAGAGMDENALIRSEAIINSMTLEERRNPSIINGSRRRRIATGSGVRVQEVNRLLRDFENIQKMMKRLPLQGKRR